MATALPLLTDAHPALSAKGHLDDEIREVELYLVRHAKVDDPQSYARLQTIPGVGKVLALVMLYEIHDIGRFAGVGKFVSYARLVRCSHESAGKKSPSKGKKIGNAHLKWAFSGGAKGVRNEWHCSLGPLSLRPSQVDVDRHTFSQSFGSSADHRRGPMVECEMRARRVIGLAASLANVQTKIVERPPQ